MIGDIVHGHIVAPVSPVVRERLAAAARRLGTPLGRRWLPSLERTSATSIASGFRLAFSPANPAALAETWCERRRTGIALTQYS
jgi:hypothetical protein